MTAVDERVEAIEHLDFEAPCEMRRCERSADLSAHCRTCGDVVLMCDRHLVLCIQRARRAETVSCLECSTHAPDFLTLVDIRPLRGKTA